MSRNLPLDADFAFSLAQIRDEVWDEIGPRTDDQSRERVREVVVDAITAMAKPGQRSPELIFVYALSRAKNALV